MLIHFQDTFGNGTTTCLVQAVDTHVIAIFAGKFHKLVERNPAADEWLAESTLDKQCMVSYVDNLSSGFKSV